MMKLKVEGLEVKEEILKFRLVETPDGVTLEEIKTGWSVIELIVVDGKINLRRCRGIEDDNFNTNADGQIEETQE